MAPTTLRYGPDEDHVGDLWLPETDGPHRVAVVIHGGYWRAGYGRDLMDAVCADLAGRGWAAWNLEYRRVGAGGGWPATFLDVAAGVDVLHALAEDHRLDLARVAAIGHSAGGQLALWTAARAGLPAGAPGAEPVVRPAGVVSQAGVCDLRLSAALGEGSRAAAALLDGAPDERPERYALASPAERVPLGVPQGVVHGDRDADVSLAISERYAERARAAGDDAELVVLPGADHFALIDPGTRAWAACLAQLERVVAL
jgi:acetyl esterase/lipase